MHVGEGDFFYRPESSPDNDRWKLFISSWRMYGKLLGQVKLLLKYYSMHNICLARTYICKLTSTFVGTK